MSIYQVSIVFEADSDATATLVAEKLSSVAAKADAQGVVSSPKIAFTKFEPEVSNVEQEAPEVA